MSWHQDYSYWTWTKPRSHLTCWVGLDDADEQSGCLWYVPKSHKWGLLPMTGLASDMDTIKTVLSDDEGKQMDDTKVAAVLKRGEAVLHHPLAMHGSYGNTSARQRRATVINAMGDGVVCNAENMDLGKFPTLPNDEQMIGPCYPLLASAEEAQLMEAAAGVLGLDALPNNAPTWADAVSFDNDMAHVAERSALATYEHRF